MKPQVVSVFNVVGPQDGGWSLMPMENLLRGFRNPKDVMVLELFGVDGVVGYRVRTNTPDGVSGMFHSYFPQARVDRKERETGYEDQSDWLTLQEHELAMVQPLFLARESYLPLRIFDDRTIEQSGMDPLAGVIGVLATATRSSGGTEGMESRLGGDRLGVRLVIKPAREDWNAPWQKRMQQRRDGEDRAARPGSPDSQGPGMGTIASIGGLAGIGALNWHLWNQGNVGMLVLADVAALLLGIGGLALMKKLGGSGKRVYMDELLVEEKLKSLAYWCEVQLVRIYSSVGDESVASNSVAMLMDCLRSFDDPAGNAWAPGRMRLYSGEKIARGTPTHPFFAGTQEMDWVDERRARATALSAREVASLWHPPLGADEMASMERTAVGVLVPYLADLGAGGEDSGPLVGKMVGSDSHEIRLPESSIQKHALIIGKSGVGKSTMVKHVLAHKLDRKAKGLDNGAVVVIDPHADLVRDVLTMVPPEIADKVRLLDFGRTDRVPGINLLDPQLFPDRDRCVDTIVVTVKHLWDHWGGRLEDLLKRSLSIIYEFNSHPLTERSEMLTMLDILALLDEGVTVGTGASAKTQSSGFQTRTLERVTDPRLKQWFASYLNWPRETRAEAVGPVHSRVGAFAADARASVIMGQRESTISLSGVLSEGLVLLVSTAQGSIGVQPAALMGGTMVSLVESALRDQESIPGHLRAKCLLVCDEFQTVTGANWEGMLAESRKYGCSLMLATQSLARLDTPERKLKAGILGNVGCIVGYQMSADDARIIAPEMDADRVKETYLVNLDPHNCYVRINTESRCYQAFSMKTLPPPDIVRGSQKAVEAVMEASIAYTVDWASARARMNEEVNEQIELSKMDSSGGSQGNAFSSALDGKSARNRDGGRREGRGDGSPPGGGGDADGGGRGPDKVPPAGAPPASPANGAAVLDGAGAGDNAGDGGGEAKLGLNGNGTSSAPAPPARAPAAAVSAAVALAAAESVLAAEGGAAPNGAGFSPSPEAVVGGGNGSAPEVDPAAAAAAPPAGSSKGTGGASAEGGRPAPDSLATMFHVMPEDSLDALHGKMPGKDAATLARERAEHPRVKEGPIRGTRLADLLTSKYERVFLERFAEDVNTDSGLRAVIDRRIVSHLKAARRIIDRDRDAIKAEGVREYLEKHGGGRAGYDADRKRVSALNASNRKAEIRQEAEQKAREGVEIASAAAEPSTTVADMW